MPTSVSIIRCTEHDGTKVRAAVRRAVEQSACIGCGVCQGHCPQQAINRSGRDLAIDYRSCIRCFCCQEFRPQGAITVGKGWVLRRART